MDDWIEITHAAFNRLWTPCTPCHTVERLEHATRHFYHVDGVSICEVNNFVSDVRQFFIRDITHNAEAETKG